MERVTRCRLFNGGNEFVFYINYSSGSQKVMGRQTFSDQWVGKVGIVGQKQTEKKYQLADVPADAQEKKKTHFVEYV